jgi:hypothetical protein
VIIGPISVRKKEIAQSVGMVLLLGLMGFAIRNDLVYGLEGTGEKIEWQQEDSKQDQANEQRQKSEVPTPGD